MTLEEVQSIIKEISCLPYQITARPSQYGELILIEVMRIVPDRETQALIPLRLQEASFPHEFASEKAVVRITQTLIHKLVVHEVNEQFLYEGKRIFDPHTDVRWKNNETKP